MNLYVVKETDVRVHETATGVMTTLISPSLGESELMSLWKVSMSSGKSGPAHVISSQQIWHVIVGRAAIAVDGELVKVGTGDTVAVPGDVVRQVTAIEDCLFGVYGTSDAKASARPGDVNAITPPWIA